MVSEDALSKSKNAQQNKLPAFPFYALCVDNGDGYHAISLHPGKPYKVVKPRRNDPNTEFRVVDEEGEDYLYPREWFVPIELKPRQRRKVEAALSV